jgi:hypothetical protein
MGLIVALHFIKYPLFCNNLSSIVGWRGALLGGLTVGSVKPSADA